MKKIFIIAPVRNILPAWKQALEDYIEELQRQDCLTYYPPRDTTQDDTSWAICRQNREAILWADEIHIAWDGESTDCLFDLGIALAFNKIVVPIVGFFPPRTPHKSFATLVHDWAIRIPAQKEKQWNP